MLFLRPDQQWRLKTTLSEISPLLRKTIIAKEDRYFYYHPGVNLFALGKAVVHDIFHPHLLTGASTITMQVAKALAPGRRTIWQKAVEIFRAFQLEIKYSKDEILQLYLNLVPYGGNIQGVKSAAYLYFQKNPDHLSLAEITALSIIPNRPSSRAIGKHNARIEIARNAWLRRFASEKIFTSKEIEDALHEPLTAFRHSMPALLPQFSIRIKKQAAGDVVQTGIDLNKQQAIEKLVLDYAAFTQADANSEYGGAGAGQPFPPGSSLPGISGFSRHGRCGPGKWRCRCTRAGQYAEADVICPLYGRGTAYAKDDTARCAGELRRIHARKL